MIDLCNETFIENGAEASHLFLVLIPDLQGQSSNVLVVEVGSLDLNRHTAVNFQEDKKAKTNLPITRRSYLV